jgi:hypothetical protein
MLARWHVFPDMAFANDKWLDKTTQMIYEAQYGYEHTVQLTFSATYAGAIRRSSMERRFLECQFLYPMRIRCPRGESDWLKACALWSTGLSANALTSKSDILGELCCVCRPVKPIQWLDRPKVAPSATKKLASLGLCMKGMRLEFFQQ